MPNDITIAIKAANISALRDAVNSGEFEKQTGCPATVKESNASIGIASGTDILLLSLGVLGGVPAGVIANMIYDKLKTAQSENTHKSGITIMIDNEVATDIEGLEILLKMQAQKSELK